jgi:hypothetical protein
MALAPLGWLNKNKSKVAERDEAARKGWLSISGMSNRAFSDFLQECYRAHDTRKKTAAVAGTDMHAGLEAYIRDCLVQDGEVLIPDPAAPVEVQTFFLWAEANVSQFLWSEAHCYSERLWTGGICDFGAILKDRTVAAGDFKSSREAYFDQFIQVGGYARQIKESGLWTSEGAPISTGIRHIPIGALIIFPFGGTEGPTIQTNVEGYMTAFEGCVALHKA